MRKLTFQNIEDRAVKEPMSGCWIWMGYMNANGYGIAGTSKLAHRVSYEYAVDEDSAPLEPYAVTPTVPVRVWG